MSAQLLPIEFLARFIRQLQIRILDQQSIIYGVNESYRQSKSQSNSLDKTKTYRPEKGIVGGLSLAAHFT